MLTTVIFFKRVETTNKCSNCQTCKTLGGDSLDEDQSLKIVSKTSSLVFEKLPASGKECICNANVTVVTCIRRYDISFKHS